ncbi:MAG: hypothetical protein H7A25_04040 [Leptospiraceae bacterium]|nr:hypothetical protein [Leptospiraceae bacterium]MCP5499046.1 hypothetical protein [Leptospiraceae bacterium]
MRQLKLSSIFTLVSFYFFSCSLMKKQEADPTQVYTDCMETFKDEAKCTELAKKTAKYNEDKSIYRKQDLDKEAESKLRIRDELKDELQSKNITYVLNVLGEPDERHKDASGRTYFYYYRPIARYSPEHDPDKEIKVIFIRGRVSRVNHTPPDTTPKSGFDPYNFLRNKENVKSEK